MNKENEEDIDVESEFPKMHRLFEELAALDDQQYDFSHAQTEQFVQLVKELRQMSMKSDGNIDKALVLGKAEAFVQATKVGRKLASQICNSEEKYDMEPAVQSMKIHFGSEDLSKFEIDHLGYSSVTMQPMYYSEVFENEEMPPRKQQRRKKDDETAEKKTMQRMEKGNIEKENEQNINPILDRMVKIFKQEYCLRNETPIEINEFIIDKSDYNQTVYNLFYTTFLLNDGKLRGTLRDDGSMYLRLPLPGEEVSNEDVQCVQKMNGEIWKNSEIEKGILEKYKNK